MLQAATPAIYITTKSRTTTLGGSDRMADDEFNSDAHSDDDDASGCGKSRNKSRRELPAGAVATLKSWLLSPEHFTHPYPTPQDQALLMQKTGIDKKQLKNWFTNARRRIWKPMLKKQLEQGKLTVTGTGGGVAMPGVVPGLMVPGMPGQIQDQVQQYQQTHQVQSMQEVQVDQYGNQIYQHQPLPQPGAPTTSQYYDPNTGATSTGNTVHHNQPPMNQAHAASAAGSLQPAGAPVSNQQQLSKTDSHAVLMELFARDQDLVRQATETAAKRMAGQNPVQQQPSSLQQGGQLGQGQQQQQHHHQQQVVSSQHPMKTPSHGRLMSVPTLNSWPHFSSVSSLNNLGTMPGVKSITSLSAADLAKQGPVNTVGNLAQVKSVESMGKNDSYAFLEVFFGDRSSNALSSMGGGAGAYKDQRGVKRERDEDNDVGLSLEDESPSTGAGGNSMRHDSVGSNPLASSSTSDIMLNPFASDRNMSDSTDTLKRAYDDAMAARGLIAVSRSSEKLTDLALPVKMQRTLSQDILRQQQQQNMAQSSLQYVQFQYTPVPAPTPTEHGVAGGGQSHQYPAQPTAQSDQGKYVPGPSDGAASTSVEVPSATKCAICFQTNVDTQLRPCGHMFHEKCLKPYLQSCMGAPKCPIDHIPMQSALLAIPTDENSKPRQSPNPMSQPLSWNSGPMQQGQVVVNSKQH